MTKSCYQKCPANRTTIVAVNLREVIRKKELKKQNKIKTPRIDMLSNVYWNAFHCAPFTLDASAAVRHVRIQSMVFPGTAIGVLH